MSLIEIILIGIALALDCFAVSVCYGLMAVKFRWKPILRLALLFGGFQAAMTVIGWLAGISFERYIATFDHWLAFGLLGIIGIKMLVEAIRKKDDTPCIQFNRISVLISLSFATSIDALIVGMGFAFLQVDILTAVIIIGIISALFTLLGIFAGKKFGKLLGKKAEMIGGIVLIAIGLKTLIEHLFFS